MAKPLKTIDLFFKRKFDKTVDDASSASNLDVSACNLDVSVDDQHPPKSPRVEHTEVDGTFLERDPGLRRQIWEYPHDQCDEIRRAYINSLCQALQQKSQDIVNAMHLVSSTKSLLVKLREEGWSNLFEIIQLVCEYHNIDIPDMNAPYSKKIKGRSRHQQENITLEHQYYRIDIFYGAIDSQLQELNNRFSEKAVELIILSSALDPRDGYKFFKIDDICKLAKKFYPKDFTETDIDLLKYQLQHYEVDIPKHPVLQNMSTISELCRGLVETEKSKIYYLIDRLIRLILILPVFTTTTERAFATMKRVKTQLRNTMGDDFFADYLSANIEKEIALTFTSDSIIDDFYSLKNRRAQLL